ncbi:class I adenylate-forming enzyme family protein [Paenibacillus sp. KS-LC4]|uniref:class I adenylate-forming enzyme family protein n=1 Tax=Paenibacillus sp. KS-LC4 TaxID=2979727 RepID=UPI0030CB1131
MIKVTEWLDSLANKNAVLTDFSGASIIEVSYKEFMNCVSETAMEWSKLGVVAGSTVLLSLPSHLSLLIHTLALVKLGAAPAPISNHLTGETFRHICHTVQPCAILSTQAKMEQSLITEFEVKSARFAVFHPLKLFVRKNRAINSSLENCCILSTTGSTGLPKSVVHASSSLLQNALLHMNEIDKHEGGSYIASLPIFYSYGLVAGVLGALSKGKNIYFPEQPFYPRGWFDLCEQQNISLASITPSLLKRLLATDRIFPSTLRKLTIGGDLSDQEDLEQLQAVYSGDIYLTYGLSEAGPRVMTQKLKKNYTAEQGVPMGRPLSGIELKLDDAYSIDGDEYGELWVKTPTAMLGYLQDKQFRRDDFNGEWLRTGDIVRRTKGLEQDVFFVERKKNIIVSGGEKLYPGIIRNVLLQHPLVVEAMIFSLPSERWGNVPAAAIKLVSEAAENELPLILEWCKSRLRGIETPHKLVIEKDLIVSKK